MKILMITEKDAANASLAKIADSFLKNKHEIVIYAPFYSESVLKFFNKKISIFPICELTEEAVKDCDIIFASIMSLTNLPSGCMSIKKPIITQSYLINKQLQNGGDFCFIQSLNTFESYYDEYLKYPKLEIGEPKYDDIEIINAESKRLLFIDSGHYPFGIEGKRELAKTLLNICNSFSEYELCIKPRFLPKDEVRTHINTLHLYDVIREEAGDNLPKNLLMLMEHKDLKELIDSSHTVICMYTTAFVGAYTSGKGLVILDNLPSDDIYDVRLKSFNNIKDYMIKSGALVNYKNVHELLPHGVKCSDEYLNYLLAEKNNVADKICEVTEYLFEKFYKYGKFPKIDNYSYKNYKEKIRVDTDITWEKIIKNRYENYFLWKALVFLDYRVNASLNISSLIDKLKESGALTTETFNDVSIYRNECIVENKKLMLNDEIDSGILLDAFYSLGKYEEIKKFHNKKLGAYNLFRAFIAFDEGEYDIAVEELEKYMELTLTREYIKEISDMSNNKMNAFYILIDSLLRVKKQEKAKKYLYKMKEYYKLLYSELKSNDILNKVQAQHYTFLNWAEKKIEGLKPLRIFHSNGKIFIYGNQNITKKIIFKDTELKNKVEAIIEDNSKLKDFEGIPVINCESIVKFENIKIVVVAIPDEYKIIKAKLLSLRNDLEVISINEVF